MHPFLLRIEFIDAPRRREMTEILQMDRLTLFIQRI